MKKKKCDLTKMRDMPKSITTIIFLFFLAAFFLFSSLVIFLPVPSDNQENKNFLIFLYRWAPVGYFIFSGVLFNDLFVLIRDRKCFRLIAKEYFDGKKILVKTSSNLEGFDYLFLLLDLRDWNQDQKLSDIINNVIERANKKISIFGYPFELCLYDPQQHAQILEEQNKRVHKLNNLMCNHLINSF